VQYAAAPDRALLDQAGLQPSMGAVGNCYDNIFAERVIGTLKNEYGLHLPFPDDDLVQRAVPEAIYYYNTDRPHLALDMAVPQAVYAGRVANIRPVVIPGVME
jgi:putative transposase